ncbi:hypothetical protein BpHYR1_013286 [Brachionus plicatilis]|uniref:Uncharacterized protein n=1 Tax=Brachionus plicatilis TaxID=10195 RepID=A0A3M7RWB9_BRAPC|nr:hypothetical protein BpHYR1_013286 [Brachionus plicatilis]
MNYILILFQKKLRTNNMETKNLENLPEIYKFLGFDLIPKTEKKINQNLKQIKIIDDIFTDLKHDEQTVQIEPPNYFSFNTNILIPEDFFIQCCKKRLVSRKNKTNNRFGCTFVQKSMCPRKQCIQQSRLISPVLTAQSLATLSDDAVSKYSESQVNAKSQIHLLPLCLLSLHSLIKLKSTVLQILAVPSAEELTLNQD